MLTLSGRVKETQQVLATQFSFRLRTPELNIKVRQTVNQENVPGENINMNPDLILFSCFSHTADREGHGRGEDGSRDFIY